TTNINGSYAINVPANATTLVFSFMGMTTQEREIAGMTTIDVVMGSGATELEGVIVTAYGTTRREAFTGSAAQVSGAALQERTQSNIGKALAGAATGVQVASSSGQPGAEATIRIRGVGSFSSSQDPLIIVDGVPYTSPLSTINMNDVDALTVLKDAAANAMYGARGANGVVLITTKRGRPGQAQVQFEAKVGFNQRAIPQYDVVNSPGQYMELFWESLHNSDEAGRSGNRALYASQQLLGNAFGTRSYNPFGGVPDGQFLVGLDGKLNSNAKLLYQDDWFNEASQIGVRQEYTASVSGGTEKTTAFLSLGYLDDNSYTVNSNFKRYNARLKVDQEMTEWLKTGMNLAYSKRLSNLLIVDGTSQGGGGSLYSNLFQFAQVSAPIFPIWKRDVDGNFILDDDGNRVYDWGVDPARPSFENTNPIASNKLDIRSRNSDQLMGSFYVDVKFLNDFTFTANLTIQNNNAYNINFQNPVGGDGASDGGRGYHTMIKDFDINTQQLLKWEKSFGVHNFDGLLGHEFSKNNYRYLQASRITFFLPDNPYLNTGIGTPSIEDNFETNLAYDSYFARLQYNYAYKYYLSASFRRDASSRFHPDNRWGNFWAVGGAWRMEQENFMKQFNFVDLLKFKTSYGLQGNDQILYGSWSPTVVYEDLYSITKVGPTFGISKYMHGVKDLTWETSHNFNIGFDFALFRKLSGSIEYYNKKTVDMLYVKQVPTESPSWIFENSMSMRNYGIEIELSYDIMHTKDLKWTVSGNITTQQNKLLTLPDDRDPRGYASGQRFYSIGGSIFDNYSFQFAGVDPGTGKQLWWADYDANGNHIKHAPLAVDESRGIGPVAYSVRTDNPDLATYRIIKSGLVKAYGGLRTNVQYKNFDFAITTAYQIGGYGNDGGYSSLVNNMSSNGFTIHTDQANNRWQKPGDVTNFAGLNRNMQTQADDFAYTTKSAFALQSIGLGYTVPKSILNRYKIEGMRIYATVDNTAFWSARRGFDPRISVGGGTSMQFPEQRTYSLGININF
ncbi:MAG: SusC/RagA family TonB-linked outer membrane protein, partial [Bacteroidales bacterium]|nr:SusC/RagA family TonB-linked outer membrane protein [Bacteroidales bacterium]